MKDVDNYKDEKDKLMGEKNRKFFTFVITINLVILFSNNFMCRKRYHNKHRKGHGCRNRERVFCKKLWERREFAVNPNTRRVLSTLFLQRPTKK